MVNKILKKSVDLGKKVADTQAFEEYLGRLTENFWGEVKDKIKPATTMAYNMCVDACCSYRLFKSNGKKYIRIVLTNHLDYVVSREDLNCIPYLIEMDYRPKAITIDYDVFLRALEINGFTYSIDIDKENFEMIDGEKLDYITGQLNITKNYLEMPKKTAVERSRKRLLLRLIYPDDKKWL